MAQIGDPDWEPEYSMADGPARACEYVQSVLDVGDWAVTYVDAGVMNYVYRVSTAAGEPLFYFKQALARVKQHDRLGADLASVSPSRIEVEFRAITPMRATLPAPYRQCVPRTCKFDRVNNILWTYATLPGSVCLQDELVAGRFDVVTARRFGSLLGAIHAITGPDAERLWPTDEEDVANWERFLRMRTYGFTERADLPAEAHGVVERLVAEGRANVRTGMISHLDAAPKNWLLRDDGEFALLDFELGAARSDPAYDPGFLAGHYLLMGQNRSEMAQASIQAVEALMAGYLEEGPEVDAGWSARVHRYAALTMLYRLHGSSPAPYLEPSRYGVIRSEALARLMRGS